MVLRELRLDAATGRLGTACGSDFFSPLCLYALSTAAEQACLADYLAVCTGKTLAFRGVISSIFFRSARR